MIQVEHLAKCFPMPGGGTLIAVRDIIRQANDLNFIGYNGAADGQVGE
jgi:hypothetical protein